MTSAQQEIRLSMQKRNQPQRAALIEALKNLRDWCPQREFVLIGYDAIATYLNEIGVTASRGGPVNKVIVQMWVVRRNFPAFCIKPAQKVRTTNYLVQAWMWSYKEYRRMRPPVKKWNAPTETSNTGADPTKIV